MFNKKTIIVVGAGASEEAKLPLGYQLKDEIAKYLNMQFQRGKRIHGDNTVFAAIDLASRRDNPNKPDINSYLYNARIIRDAMPLAMSIDHFINAHQGNSGLELCGKLAIVRSILEAERNSLLYFDESREDSDFNPKPIEGTWFNAFFQLLTENCQAKELTKRLSAVKLIVFNYDRCIEHFLYHSLRTYYGIDHGFAAELVQGIEIFHPYGTVGNLHWYGHEHYSAFGANPTPEQLLNLAGQIKTFTEGTNPDSSDVVAIRNGMAEADIVLFLGFAFHPMNLELIRPIMNVDSKTSNVGYYGTTKDISSSDRDRIFSELVGLSGVRAKPIELHDMKCSELFHEYWRTLSLS